MTGICTNDNLNFWRQNGRKSVWKEEKTPSRASKSHVIPSRLRNKSEKQSDTKIKLGFSKNLNDVYIRTEEHPMIINRMQDSANMSRLSEKRSNTANVASPANGSKDGDRMSFENSYNPSVLINSKWTCKYHSSLYNKIIYNCFVKTNNFYHSSRTKSWQEQWIPEKQSRWRCCLPRVLQLKQPGR